MIDTQKLKEIMANNLKKQLKRKGISQTMMARDLNIPEIFKLFAMISFSF